MLGNLLVDDWVTCRRSNMTVDVGASMRRASSCRIVILLNVLLVAFVLTPSLALLEPGSGLAFAGWVDLVDHGWRLPDTDPYFTPPDWYWVEHAWLTDGLFALIIEVWVRSGGIEAGASFGVVTGLAWWVGSGCAAVPTTYRLTCRWSGSLWVALLFSAPARIGQSGLGWHCCSGVEAHSSKVRAVGLDASAAFLLGQSAWRIYSGLFLLTVLLSLSPTPRCKRMVAPPRRWMSRC